MNLDKIFLEWDSSMLWDKKVTTLIKWRITINNIEKNTLMMILD
jgi:hypothetical protein